MAQAVVCISEVRFSCGDAFLRNESWHHLQATTLDTPTASAIDGTLPCDSFFPKSLPSFDRGIMYSAKIVHCAFTALVAAFQRSASFPGCTVDLRAGKTFVSSGLLETSIGTTMCPLYLPVCDLKCIGALIFCIWLRKLLNPFICHWFLMYALCTSTVAGGLRDAGQASRYHSAVNEVISFDRKAQELVAELEAGT